jgi:lipopolysaccharide biosynthesis regulator YciM
MDMSTQEELEQKSKEELEKMLQDLSQQSSNVKAAIAKADLMISIKQFEKDVSADASILAQKIEQLKNL